MTPKHTVPALVTRWRVSEPGAPATAGAGAGSGHGQEGSSGRLSLGTPALPLAADHVH